jgi:hypothetical protein
MERPQAARAKPMQARAIINNSYPISDCADRIDDSDRRESAAPSAFRIVLYPGPARCFIFYRVTISFNGKMQGRLPVRERARKETSKG